MSPRSPSTFEIIPAIDLRGGRVVRLRQGDFAREQIYADDPLAVAREFAEAGARWIHIVDLEGALAGERRQAGVVTSVVEGLRGIGPRIQVAGGLRTADALAAVLDAGADRVVVGTAALRDPDFVPAAIARHGAQAIAVALDIRDGQAVGDGWVAGAAGVPIETALAGLTAAGVTTFAVTAIERDGLLGGPDLALLGRTIGRTSAELLASGGIRSVADLEAVRSIGCAGAIVGRAIYDGRLELRAAIAQLAAGG